MQGAGEPLMAQHDSHSAPVLSSDSKSSSSSKTLAQVWVDAAATASPGQHFSVCTQSMCVLPVFFFAAQLPACLQQVLSSTACITTDVPMRIAVKTTTSKAALRACVLCCSCSTHSRRCPSRLGPS